MANMEQTVAQYNEKVRNLTKRLIVYMVDDFGIPKDLDTKAFELMQSCLGMLNESLELIETEARMIDSMDLKLDKFDTKIDNITKVLARIESNSKKD